MHQSMYTGRDLRPIEVFGVTADHHFSMSNTYNKSIGGRVDNALDRHYQKQLYGQTRPVGPTKNLVQTIFFPK